MPNKTPGNTSGTQSNPVRQESKVQSPKSKVWESPPLPNPLLPRREEREKSGLRRWLLDSGFCTPFPASAIPTHKVAVPADNATEFQITPGTARNTPGSSVQVRSTPRICSKGNKMERNSTAAVTNPHPQNQRLPSCRRIALAATVPLSRGHLISARRKSRSSRKGAASKGQLRNKASAELKLVLN